MLRCLACNFGIGDILIGLTYDENNKPGSYKEAENLIKNFKRRLARAMKKHGAKLEYISVTEGVNDLHRIHHHMIIKNAFPGAFELVISMWGHGIIHCKYVEPNADGTPGYGDIAAYFTKENREDGGVLPVGKRSWTASKGLRRSVITRKTVSDRYTVRIPAGAITVDPVTVLRSDWGSVQTCSYILPSKLERKEKAAGEAPALNLEEGYNFHASGWVEYCPPGAVGP